jgi:DNA-binding transcriptional regulator of glucitol operon
VRVRLAPFLTRRWLGLHLLLVVSVLGLARVGLWQWDKAAGGGGSWQNYGYAVQWWLFAGFAVFLYVKLVLDELDPSRLEDTDPGAGLPPVVQPQAEPPAVEEDDELAAYNRYLQSLHHRSGR